MNIEALRQSASTLQDLLQRYSGAEPDAALCLNHLGPLFGDIAASETFVPLKGAAPCGYYFHEGSLRQCPGLEQAYAEFSMLAQGQDRDQLQALLAATKRGPNG